MVLCLLNRIVDDLTIKRQSFGSVDMPKNSTLAPAKVSDPTGDSEIQTSGTKESLHVYS